jgi:hypothetical protein
MHLGELTNPIVYTLPIFQKHYKKNTFIHDGLLWSQTSENASQLTHHDDRKKRHVSRVIH